MAESTAERAFSLIDPEREILADAGDWPSDEPRQLEFAPPRMRSPSLVMPDVEHREGVTSVGKLSAEAVAFEYEAAAKAIEATSAELMERVRECEARARHALAAFEAVKTTARQYREKAQAISLQIEHCNAMSAAVRQTCAELSGKIAPVATDKPSRKSRRRRNKNKTAQGEEPGT
jgi:chromosome segregation ATPase